MRGGHRSVSAEHGRADAPRGLPARVSAVSRVTRDAAEPSKQTTTAGSPASRGRRAGCDPGPPAVCASRLHHDTPAPLVTAGGRLADHCAGLLVARGRDRGDPRRSPGRPRRTETGRLGKRSAGDPRRRYAARGGTLRTRAPTRDRLPSADRFRCTAAPHCRGVRVFKHE